MIDNNQNQSRIEALKAQRERLFELADGLLNLTDGENTDPDQQYFYNAAIEVGQRAFAVQRQIDRMNHYGGQ